MITITIIITITSRVIIIPYTKNSRVVVEEEEVVVELRSSSSRRIE